MISKKYKKAVVHLGKYSIDVSKLVIAAFVIGGIVKQSDDANLMLILGLTTATILLVVGVLLITFYEKED
jgi:hypothetical protein